MEKERKGLNSENTDREGEKRRRTNTRKLPEEEKLEERRGRGKERIKLRKNQKENQRRSEKIREDREEEGKQEQLQEPGCRHTAQESLLRSTHRCGVGLVATKL
jgi:hypothetical protein